MVDAGLVANAAILVFVAANGYLVGLAARGRLGVAGAFASVALIGYIGLALVLGVGFNRFLAADFAAFAVGILYAGPNDRPFDDGAHLIALIRRPLPRGAYVVGGLSYAGFGIGIAALDAWWAPHVALVAVLGVAFTLNYPLHAIRKTRASRRSAETGKILPPPSSSPPRIESVREVTRSAGTASPSASAPSAAAATNLPVLPIRSLVAEPLEAASLRRVEVPQDGSDVELPPTANRDAQDMIEVRCHVCQHRIAAPVSSRGLSLRCLECGALTEGGPTPRKRLRKPRTQVAAFRPGRSRAIKPATAKIRRKSRKPKKPDEGV